MQTKQQVRFFTLLHHSLTEPGGDGCGWSLVGIVNVYDDGSLEVQVGDPPFTLEDAWKAFRSQQAVDDDGEGYCWRDETAIAELEPLSTEIQ